MADTYSSIEDPRDWRGVPIEVGALVIYGAPVGRSIAMVEGTVDGFTKSGRVNVRVIRRAYGYSDMKPVVHVGQDRLTVVSPLPESLMPTEAEKNAEGAARLAERERIHATHGEFEKTELRPGFGYRYVPPGPCSRCGLEYRRSFQQECEVS